MDIFLSIFVYILRVTVHPIYLFRTVIEGVEFERNSVVIDRHYGELRGNRMVKCKAIRWH